MVVAHCVGHDRILNGIIRSVLYLQWLIGLDAVRVRVKYNVLAYNW